jgi:hypothetical protein
MTQQLFDIRGSLCVLALLGAALPAAAQQPVYQSQQDTSVQLKGDGMFRQEWTQDILNPDGSTMNQNRWRLQLRPRLELGLSWLRVGVGGDFNYSKDQNVDVTPRPTLVRDNYDSRSARLDLAFASLQPVGWLRIEGGRFVMPVALTEMIWDADLRPQGGAVTLEVKGDDGTRRLAATAVGAKGSHVFDDSDTTMLILSGEADVPTGAETKIQLLGSYIKFDDVQTLEPLLRRQNTRLPSPPGVPGVLAYDYHVWDVIARLRHEGHFTMQLVADYCWNAARSQDNRGLWLAAILGSTQTAVGRLDYTYARVDSDATLAAYATDDFFWETGWEGHRVGLAVKSGPHSTLHAIGQLQRFYDSPQPAARDHWVKRFRLEVRIGY